MKKNQSQTIQLYDHNKKPTKRVRLRDLVRIGNKVSNGTTAVDTSDGERHYIQNNKITK